MSDRTSIKILLLREQRARRREFIQAALRDVTEYKFPPEFTGIWRTLSGNPWGEWPKLGYQLHIYVRGYLESVDRAKQKHPDCYTRTPATVFVLKRLSGWCADRGMKYGNLPMESTFPRYDLAKPGTHGSLLKKGTRIYESEHYQTKRYPGCSE
jgi:hypothetical protein